MNYKEAYFYNIPCLYFPGNNELKGKNVFFDLLLSIMVFIHCYIIIPMTGIYDFPIKIRK